MRQARRWGWSRAIAADSRARRRNLARTGYYFVLAFSQLTFIFMYIVLAAQPFPESFIHPITLILLTLGVAFAVPFGIVALLIAGQTVNIFSGLGLLLLFGIVKKNAILQIDHAPTGCAPLGCRGTTRLFRRIVGIGLRPILMMTTMALLVAGMLVPLVVSHGTGAATNRSIGVAGGGWTKFVSAVDAAGGAGILFAVEKTWGATSRCVWRREYRDGCGEARRWATALIGSLGGIGIRADGFGPRSGFGSCSERSGRSRTRGRC